MFVITFLQDLLDNYLLGSSNIFVGAYKNMPLATREMECLVAENCKLIDSLRADMRDLCDQDISMRSVKKILLSRLEELLEKVCSYAND
jgi:midasin